MSAYNAFGVAGMLLVALITLGLTVARSLSIPVALGLLALALIVSILNIVITTLITGRDSLVFLRYFLSIMAVSVFFLRIIDQPILPYLENLMLGIGAMQGIGRIGCLRVGCCYGKPARFGIRYTSLHAKAGFPKALVGVKLLPIQLIESCWVLFSVGVGVSLALTSIEAGYGFASYLVLFASGRFCFDFLRGDKARTQLGAFSEAQWISLVIVFCTILLELQGLFPFHFWHVAIGCALSLFVVYLFTAGFNSAVYRLSTPTFILALAKALEVLKEGRSSNLAGPHAVHVRKINQTMQISDGVFSENDHQIHHYTLTLAGKGMPVKEAKQISKMLQSWRTQKEKSKLIHHNHHTFHLLRYLNTQEKNGTC